MLISGSKRFFCNVGCDCLCVVCHIFKQGAYLRTLLVYLHISIYVVTFITPFLNVKFSIYDAHLASMHSHDAWSAPSHYLNQCWNTVNSNLRYKLQWNPRRNSFIFILENAFKNVVCEMASIWSRPHWVNPISKGSMTIGNLGVTKNDIWSVHRVRVGNILWIESYLHYVNYLPPEIHWSF